MGLFSKIKLSDILSAKAVSSQFGCDRGTPLDRYYIERFLASNSHYIKGQVLEMGEDTYTKRFGRGINQSDTFQFGDIHNGVPSDLCNPSSLRPDHYDCFICTQTFNFIFDFNSAIRGAHFLLKPGGVLLATLACMAPISAFDAERWGDFWRFTPQSAQRIFQAAFAGEKVDVSTMGNSAVASLFMKGYAMEDLPRGIDLDAIDPLVPLIITVLAVK